MTRAEREMFDQLGGEIPRGVLTCVPEWYVPTRADRVADEERLKKVGYVPLKKRTVAA